ncbi:serine hydrolase domain-containing protein [Rubrivirga sp. IMCC43871]|uniref:serine hydrolase domain-containing protein n=1 Tax=Rubrivirga sp. IMCC43871 TaxID=3391575 RepID=UPI00398FD10A
MTSLLTDPTYRRRLLTTLVVLVAASASAQPAPTPHGVDLDSLAHAFIATTGAPSVVLGVVVDGRRYVVSAGEVNGAAPDEHTLYEIASVTKVFTSVLLADAVVRGETTLEAPLADVLGAPVGAHAAGPIRLVDLATHTSGLPRLDPAMDQAEGHDARDPYAMYGPDDLLAFLADAEPATGPGEAPEYSNTAVGALGYALARQADTTYGALVADRVLAPLAMRETFTTVPDSLADRVAAGGTEAQPIPAWSWGEATVGAGGLRSSVADLLTFAQAVLDPAATPLADALALTLEPRVALGDRQAHGLAWSLFDLNGGGTLAVHEGSTYGSSSLLGVVPNEGLAVVALANQAGSVGGLAVDVLGRLRTARAMAGR